MYQDIERGYNSRYILYSFIANLTVAREDGIIQSEGSMTPSSQNHLDVEGVLFCHARGKLTDTSSSPASRSMYHTRLDPTCHG